MKKALVIALMFVLGLGIVAFAGPLSGSWESELTIGFRDVVVTDPGTSFIVPGDTYAVSQGSVTIGDRTVSGTYYGETYTTIIPGDTYFVGPWDVTVYGDTFDVTQGTVTISDRTVSGTYLGETYTTIIPGDTYDVGPWEIIVEGDTYDVTDGTFVILEEELTVPVDGGMVTVTIPEQTFEVPDFYNKTADIAFPVEDKFVSLPLPTVDYSYSGTVGYSYVLYLQTSSTVLQVGTGTLDLEEIASTELTEPEYNCAELAWEWPGDPLIGGNYPTVDLPAFHRELHPHDKTFQIDLDPEVVVVKQDDAIHIGQILLVGRTASGVDSLGNVVEIIIDDHTLDFEVVDPAATIELPANWAYTPAGFEGHYLVFEIPKDDYPVTWPAGWNRCYELDLDELTRPFVTVELDTVDVYFYQVLEDISGTPAQVAAGIWLAIDENRLDKTGLCFLSTDSVDFEFPADDNIAKIGFGTLVGTAQLGTFEQGTQTIIIEAYDVEGTYEGGTVTVTIPEMEILITGQTVFIPDQIIEIEADSITILDYEFDIVVDDQVITIKIPGDTYYVSAQTVFIPDQIINVPEDSITILDYEFDIVVDDQVITIVIPGNTYYVSAQTVTIPDQLIILPARDLQTITKVPTLGFTSTLIVDYTVCGWVFNSTSKFDDTGWIAQSFAADGVLGAFTLGSDLVFCPAGASFTSWDSTVSVSIAGVAFDAEFLLEALGAGWTFGASGGAGDCDFGATVYFNMDSDGNLIADEYCFCFSSVDFDISFPFACIDLVDISIGFSTAGFDGITFSATGIVVPGLAWLSFDVALTFDDGVLGKEMKLTPAIDLGVFSCITLYYELVNVDGLSCTTIAEISGIKFYGVGLDYTWNGVTFTSVSSFDVDYNEDLIGNADYWEVFTIASEADACCGGAFDFSVSTYFECESEMLFDWAETSIKVSMGFGSNYTGWTGLTVTDAGLTEWTIGFKVTW